MSAIRRWQSETAIQLKLDKQTRDRRICLLDLDLQASHVCDYLDIEPRLQLSEIIDNPQRLDWQLFDLFVSHHSSGVDVIASPRNRRNPVEPTIAALDALFGMIASRYDILIVDFPPHWAEWTRQILSVCDLAVVTGLNTVPGLRQVSDALGAVRSVEPIPPKIVVGLNRCEPKLLGGVARSQHIERLLGGETVLNGAHRRGRGNSGCQYRYTLGYWKSIEQDGQGHSRVCDIAGRTWETS